MTTQDAAKRLNLSAKTVAGHCKAGRIEAVLEGGRWKITAKAVADFKREGYKSVGNPNFGK